MNQPSSTITAATLAGIVMTAVWAVVNFMYYEGVDLSPALVLMQNSVTVAVVSVVGYVKKENVLPLVGN